MRVFARRHLGQPRAHQQRIGRHLLVQVFERPVRMSIAQHLVRHDGVQDGLLLPGMKVQPVARIHHVLAKPPVQQLGGGGGHEVQQVGGAIFEPQGQLVGFGRECGGEGQGIV